MELRDVKLAVTDVSGPVKAAASVPPQTKGLAEQQTMRNGQNKRMRGRNRKGGHHQNPLSRMYESNGPDVKIRGTASHVAEKYLQLARDAQSSGDPVAAENYYQHAEHYFRLIAAAQEQFRQTQPYYQRAAISAATLPTTATTTATATSPPSAASRSRRASRSPFIRASSSSSRTQPQQQQPQHTQPQHTQPQHCIRSTAAAAHAAAASAAPAAAIQPSRRRGRRAAAVVHHRRPASRSRNRRQGSSNGPRNRSAMARTATNGSPDRFPLHRRRRRHRGPRDHSMAGEGDAPPARGRARSND